MFYACAATRPGWLGRSRALWGTRPELHGGGGGAARDYYLLSPISVFMIKLDQTVAGLPATAQLPNRLNVNNNCEACNASLH